jgi:hypothetical protein
MFQAQAGFHLALDAQRQPFAHEGAHLLAQGFIGR